MTLLALTGCPLTPQSPMIALQGAADITVELGGTFIDPGFDVSNNTPLYTAAVTTVITNHGGDELPEVDTATTGTYTITYTAPADATRTIPATVTRTVRVVNPIDIDGDDFIDIDTIDKLNAIRYNLAGTSYQESDGPANTGVRCGVTGNTDCQGYELIRDLDFADGDSYASGTVNIDWRPNNPNIDLATNDGWIPLGSCNTNTDTNSDPCGDDDDTPFTTFFKGSALTIANLYARGDVAVGLFASNSGTIERIGLTNANIYGRAMADLVGGLVAFNATGGTITASYVISGGVDGGTGSDLVGGLVGNNLGTIETSYATVNVDGGVLLDIDRVGGLLGSNDETGTVTASYATGDVDGGAGNDFVGGLVGSNSGTVAASYATGGVNAGAGDTEKVGSLVGSNAETGTTIASYGFGTATGGAVAMARSTDASPLPIITAACDITEANSSTRTITPWNTAQWDFGIAPNPDEQRPVVRHNDLIVPGQTDRGC